MRPRGGLLCRSRRRPERGRCRFFPIATLPGRRNRRRKAILPVCRPGKCHGRERHGSIVFHDVVSLGPEPDFHGNAGLRLDHRSDGQTDVAPGPCPDFTVTPPCRSCSDTPANGPPYLRPNGPASHYTVPSLLPNDTDRDSGTTLSLVGVHEMRWRAAFFPTLYQQHPSGFTPNAGYQWPFLPSFPVQRDRTDPATLEPRPSFVNRWARPGIRALNSQPTNAAARPRTGPEYFQCRRPTLLATDFDPQGRPVQDHEALTASRRALVYFDVHSQEISYQDVTTSRTPQRLATPKWYKALPTVVASSDTCV